MNAECSKVQTEPHSPLLWEVTGNGEAPPHEPPHEWHKLLMILIPRSAMRYLGLAWLSDAVIATEPHEHSARVARLKRCERPLHRSAGVALLPNGVFIENHRAEDVGHKPLVLSALGQGATRSTVASAAGGL